LVIIKKKSKWEWHIGCALCTRGSGNHLDNRSMEQ